MRAYTSDIRLAAVLSVEHGECSIREAAQRFKVSRASLERWLARKRATGNAEKQMHRNKPRKLEKVEPIIRAIVQEHPDIHLQDLCDFVFKLTSIQTSPSTMYRELIYLGLGKRFDRLNGPKGQLILIPRVLPSPN